MQPGAERCTARHQLSSNCSWVHVTGDAVHPGIAMGPSGQPKEGEDGWIARRARKWVGVLETERAWVTCGIGEGEIGEGGRGREDRAAHCHRAVVSCAQHVTHVFLFYPAKYGSHRCPGFRRQLGYAVAQRLHLDVDLNVVGIL